MIILSNNFFFLVFLICRMQIFTIKVFWIPLCVCVLQSHNTQWRIYENHIWSHISLSLFCCVFFFFGISLFSIVFLSDLITVHYIPDSICYVYTDRFFYYWFLRHHLFVGPFLWFKCCFYFYFEKWADNERFFVDRFVFFYHICTSTFTHEIIIMVLPLKISLISND